MNAIKNVRVTMINAVKELFKTDNSAYAYAPALAEDVEELCLVSAELDASLQNAELSTADMTTAKQSSRVQITTTAKKMIGAGKAHASHKKDPQFKAQLTQFGKQLVKAKDTEFPLVCNNLATQLKTINPQDLAKRGVQETDIADFEAQVAQFKGDVPKTQSARGKTSTEISKSEALTVQCCDIINDRIALTMFNIKDNVPAFYALFDKASTVRKPASTQTQIKFITLDDTTGEKIEDFIVRDGDQTLDAKTTLKRPSTSKKAKAAMAAKGAKAAAVSDILEIVKEGYQVYQLPRPKFKLGKITTITVRLIPNAGQPPLKKAG